MRMGQSCNGMSDLNHGPKMRTTGSILAFLLNLLCLEGIKAQDRVDSSHFPLIKSSVEDPSQFITRVEIFSELQQFKTDFYINQSTLRSIVKLGNRFTTRVDIPVVYNSLRAAGQRNFGLGDISFRLLGYKLIQSPKSAVTASVEFSLNTAGSSLLGTGKNLIIPVITYTQLLKKFRGFASIVIQQANSFQGAENRKDINFSKVQAILLKNISKKMWIVAAPTLFIDYVDGGTSMNMEGRMTFSPKPRVNFWIQGGFGVFGDFRARYLWGTQIGYRYMMFRSKSVHGN